MRLWMKPISLRADQLHTGSLRARRRQDVHESIQPISVPADHACVVIGRGVGPGLRWIRQASRGDVAPETVDAAHVDHELARRPFRARGHPPAQVGARRLEQCVTVGSEQLHVAIEAECGHVSRSSADRWDPRPFRTSPRSLSWPGIPHRCRSSRRTIRDGTRSTPSRICATSRTCHLVVGVPFGDAVGQHDVAEGTADRERVGSRRESLVGALDVDLLAHALFHPHPAPAGAATERGVPVAVQLVVLGAGDRLDHLARALPHVVVTRVVAGVVVRDLLVHRSPSASTALP